LIGGIEVFTTKGCRHYKFVFTSIDFFYLIFRGQATSLSMGYFSCPFLWQLVTAPFHEILTKLVIRTFDHVHV